MTKDTDPTPTGLGPRAAALELLGGVLLEGRMLSEMEGDDSLTALSPSERAAAQRLARDALRLGHKADAQLKPHLRRAPPDVIQAILTLALVEILESGAPAHGVVNAAVTLAKTHEPSMAGMVNAVLRRAAEADPGPWNRATPQRLPGWLRGRLNAAWGNARTAKIEAAHTRMPPLDLTLRAPAEAEHWAKELGADILPTGSLRLRPEGQISRLPGYAEGAWWVQDAAAALPARLLDAQPGEHVLDVCAAPGGKTLQLASTGARVTALDISGPRLDRLRENLERTGLPAEVETGDALHWDPGHKVDAILLDAPCSATGTIRRHPDLPYVRDASALKSLRETQLGLATRAAGWLAPGGRMVICTCSLLPEEGEGLLAALLEADPTLELDPAPQDLLPPDWHAAQGGIRLLPDLWEARGGLDGFFMAALRKAG